MAGLIGGVMLRFLYFLLIPSMLHAIVGELINTQTCHLPSLGPSVRPQKVL